MPKQVVVDVAAAIVTHSSAKLLWHARQVRWLDEFIHTQLRQRFGRYLRRENNEFAMRVNGLACARATVAQTHIRTSARRVARALLSLRVYPAW